MKFYEQIMRWNCQRNWRKYFKW